MKHIIIKENGIVKEDSNDQEDIKVNYLNVSDMFEGITPLQMTELDATELDYFLKLIKSTNYDYYKVLINNLMDKLITSKDYDELTSNKKGSFYNYLKNEYLINRRQRKVDEKHPIADFNITPEFMSTSVRLVLRAFIELTIDEVEDADKAFKKDPYTIMKIHGRRINSIKNNRLLTDKKMDNFLKGLFKEKLSSLTTSVKGHLCNKCHFECVQDCPKVQSVIPMGMTIDDPTLDFITDGKQVYTEEVKENGYVERTTDMCVVTGCRLYGYFEEQYRKKQKESKYVEQTKPKVKEENRVLISETKYGRIYRKK